MPVRSPPTCPVLVGRDEELTALLSLLATVEAQRGVTVSVTGEAGAGKSRLVRELAKAAAERDFQILAGSCTERDADFPLGLFIDALRQQLMAPDANPRDLFGPHGEWLVELMPELRRYYPQTAATLELSPEQGKRQRFEAMAAVFARLAARQPLLLVLEDLHWADPTSLELFELLPRRLASARVLIVGTARQHEIGGRLRAALSALHRARLLVDLALEPLPAAAVERMLAAMLPAAPSPVVTQAVLSRAGGNPFFVEELLATIVPAGGHRLMADLAVPETVRDSVLRRIDSLPDDARAIVHVLAVAGQQARVDTVQAASDVDSDTLAASLVILHERGLLVDVPSPQRPVVAFKHALTRDAILDGLSPSERRPLHRQIADALACAAGSGSPVVVADAELGYHFHAAQIWHEALSYANAAGDAAWQLHATFEALGHYRRALDAALSLGHPQAAYLHCRCGQALDLLGAFESSREHFEQALLLARVSGDTAIEQTALYEAAGLFASRDYRHAQQLAEQALDLARASADPRREGLALNRLGNVLTNLEQFSAGRTLHEDALALFESHGDSWGGADSHDLIGQTRYLSGEVPEARAAFARAAEMFTALDEPQRIASALTTRGLYLAVLDGPCATNVPVRVFRDDATRGLELSRSIDWRSGEAYALVALACADIGDGSYDRAAARLDAALAIAREIGHQQWTIIARFTNGIMYADIRDDRRALEQFEQALAIAQRMGFVQWESRLLPWVARCHMRLGAIEHAEHLLAPLLSAHAPQSISQRRALFTHAEISMMQGRPDVALVVADRLLAGASGPRPAATVLLRARALVALGQRDEAARAFRDADRLAREYGPRPIRWQAADGLARLLEEQRAPTTDEIALARSEIAAISACLPLEWLDTFLSDPAVRRYTPPETAVALSGPDALTRREREVAALVATGLTNKAIALSLSVAEKTVETHVSNCLGKLGFVARVQLATWAVSQGLADPAESQG